MLDTVRWGTETNPRQPTARLSCAGGDEEERFCLKQGRTWEPTLKVVLRLPLVHHMYAYAHTPYAHTNTCIIYTHKYF